LFSTGIISKKNSRAPYKKLLAILNNSSNNLNQSSIINDATGVVGVCLVGFVVLVRFGGQQMRGGDGFFLSGCLRRQFAAGVRP
jgi:hypothetical protein